ncbi:MAG: hypothetical protein FD126_2680, partial [Elusimicrobia bacterium]
GTIVGLIMCPSKNVKLEGSDEDKDKDSDDGKDSDHKSKHTDDNDSDKDSDHHDQDSDNINTHKNHVNTWHADAHSRRLTLYFQNLDIVTKGASITQKSWKEIPTPAF